MDISKPEAARSQIETAIKLFFDDDNPISIHTLVHASFQILRGIMKSRPDYIEQFDDYRQMDQKKHGTTIPF